MQALHCRLLHRLNPCVIDGVDKWDYAKGFINTTSKNTFVIRICRSITSLLGKGIPEEYGTFHYSGKCVWVYEVEGFWSTCDDWKWD